MFMDKVITMDITKVCDDHIRPFSYFPSIYSNEWDIESVEKCENGIIYHNKVYRRIKVGYIGGKPIHVKASTYKVETFLGQTIDAPIVYYEKKKDGLVIEYDPLMF